MKVIAFSASNSQNSINKKLATYAAQLLPGAEVEILDLNDYEMPLFSEDKEKDLGHPPEAKNFFAKLGEADALVISFAEHNGSYTAAYKNLYDWVSRIDMKIYQDKPTVLLSTSPGPGGAQSVLALAKGAAPYNGGDVKADLSIANFYDVFDLETGQVHHAETNTQLQAAMAQLA